MMVRSLIGLIWALTASVACAASEPPLRAPAEQERTAGGVSQGPNGAAVPAAVCDGLMIAALSQEYNANKIVEKPEESAASKVQFYSLYINSALIAWAKRQALGCPSVSVEQLEHFGGIARQGGK